MAGTRLSGLMSGMDTESIIEQLVESRKKKVETTKKAQKTINYKQEAWNTLNTKLKNLQSKYLSNMRFTSAYAKKTTKVSNSSAASVITGEGATNGVQSLEINKLAKTAYLTGGEISSDKSFTALSSMKDLLKKQNIEVNSDFSTSFSVTNGNKELSIDVDSATTISDVLNKLKEFGLNASFDEKNQRFFISAKESGKANDFTLSASTEDGRKALSALGLNLLDDNSDGKGATKISGSNAEITLNGAKFENSNNTFDINGLTITALNETKEGESVTITTQDDTDGIYDMIKSFLKEYNGIINEMDKLYNAEDSKLEPLTDDEKYAMSDKEVEDWEKKLSDSALRRDSNLSSASSAMKSVMSAGVVINGKTMYLSDFGINTLSYFSAPDNEKNAYHIDGDSEDGDTSGNADKLMSMISNDPSTVITFFTKLSQNLYGKMSDMSKSVDGYRSYGSFYDDKKMKSDYTNYNSKISDLEDKLNAYEDKWYSKFSKMETAMAKMQSNTSAVTALLGG